MRKKSYYCPHCKKFVTDYIIEPQVTARTLSFTFASGPTVSVCKKCRSVLLELVED